MSTGPGGWLRVAVRLPAMLVLLLVCVTLFYVWHLVHPGHRAAWRNPWPRRFLAGIGRIAGLRVRHVGAKPHSGAYLLANHVSWLDILAMAGATGTAFVAHEGLAGHPLLRWLCEMNDTVFVARHDRASVGAQVAQVREALRDTGALTVFPEGTTSDGTGLLPFKSSLLSAIEPVPEGIAVQPVLLDYGPDAAAIAWVGEEHGMDNFLKILSRKQRIALTVHFLPALTGNALANRKTMAAAAREAMMGALAKAR